MEPDELPRSPDRKASNMPRIHEEVRMPVDSDGLAGSWLAEGHLQFHAGDCRRAIACYSKALQLDSRLALAFYNRSLAHEQVEEFARAEADRREAFRLAPELAETWRPIAGALASAQVDLGNRAFERGDLEEALTRYEAASRVDPTYANAHYARGLVHHQRREPERALSAYSEAIRLDAGLADAYFNRAILFLAIGDSARGIDDLNSAIRLDPTDAEFYLARSRAHAAGGDHGRAESDREEALRLESGGTE